MDTWVVSVLDTDTQQRTEYGFDRTPVRLGRSQLNELPLPYPFVSHSHGIIHVEHSRVSYVDLGSTNGSFIGTTKLTKNERAEVPPGCALRIGCLELTIEVRANGRASQHSYAFFRVPVESAPSLPSHVPQGVPQLYAAYRSSFAQLMATVRGQFATLSAADRETWTEALLRACPDLPQEHEFRALIGSQQPIQSGTVQPSIDRQLARVTGVQQGRFGPHEHERFVERMLDVTEHCLRSFVELRRGHEQFIEEMGIGVARDTGPLVALSSAEQTLRYLLEPSADASRMAELSRAFADIMTHQVAILNAVLAGGRALLDDLEPDQLQRRHGGLLGWMGRVFGYDARWASFRRAFADLREDKALAMRLFGRDFARAYATIMGRKTGDTRRGSADSTAPGIDP